MAYNMLDHVADGLVIFCGAGVSMVAPTSLPSWWQLNEQVVHALSREIEPFCGPERAADLAQQINARRDSRRFPPEFQAEIIAKHYGASYFEVLQCLDGDEPNAVHLAIARLAQQGYVRAIVTSNFDRLIEVAFRKLNVPLDVHYESVHFGQLAGAYESSSSLPSRCQLLKLHGSVDDHHTLVDTLAQRMRGLSPAICSCLRYLLRKHYWLFMGYSGADIEANAQYLCLQSEADHAIGFSWLSRKGVTREPIEAVRKLCHLYGAKAETVSGELPGWLFEQFGSLLPQDLAQSSSLSKEESDRRKQEGRLAIVNHTSEWAKTLGGVRATLVLADMLEESVSNPQAAKDLLTTVLATPLKDDLEYISIAYSLANVLINAGELDGAMTLIKKMLEKTTLDNYSYRAALLNTMGLIEEKRGDYRGALSHFEQAYATSIELKDDSNKNIALHNKAMVLTSLGEFEEARKCYEEELESVRKAGNVIAEAETLNNIGDILQEQDQYEAAINMQQQAIKLRERLGDDRGVANGMGNIAAVYQRMGDFSRARLAYEVILTIFQRIGNRSGEIITLSNLGKIAHELGDVQEAEMKYREVMSLATEHGFEPQQAGALWKLASIYRVTGRAAEAPALFDQALAIYTKSGNKDGEADVLNEIGIFLWQHKQTDEAIATFKKAIVIREKLNQLSGLCEAMGNLALALIDKNELDQAMELLKKNLAIAESIGSYTLMANAHYHIGALQHGQGEIDDALASFEMAQALYYRTGQADRTITILAIMGEICGRQGAITISLKWFDNAIQMAANTEQQMIISKRLVNILQLLLENGYKDLAQEYVQRLRSVGAEVKLTPSP